MNFEGLEDIYEAVNSSDFTFEEVTQNKKLRKEKKVKIKVDKDLKKDHKISQASKKMLKIQIGKAKKMGILPSKNQQIRIVTQSVYSPVTIMKMIESKEKIKECYVVLFSINITTSMFFEEIIKKYKEAKFIFLISSVVNTSKFQKAAYFVQVAKENDNLKLIFAHSHAKLLAIKAENNNYIIEGSGNLSAQAKIEQYIIDNDLELYDFHKKWIESIETTYKYKDLKIIE